MTASYLTQRQVEQLLRPINPKRVAVLDGLSHLEAYDVRAHLNRIFGFGRWSDELLELVELYALPAETKQKKPAVSVAYRATVRLTVKAEDGTELARYTEAAVGGSLMPEFKRADAYDMAIKTAESQALKRCAANLGDQFGLSLYRNGSVDALVTGTLVGLPEQEKKDDNEKPASVDAAAPDVVPEQSPIPEHPADEPPAAPKNPGPVTPDDPVLLAQVQGELLATAQAAGFTKVQAQRALHEQTGKALAEASVEELRMAIGAIQSKQKEKVA